MYPEMNATACGRDYNLGAKQAFQPSADDIARQAVFAAEHRLREQTERNQYLKQRALDAALQLNQHHGNDARFIVEQAAILEAYLRS